MTKNCTPKIPKNQVLLLKILKCLWNQYLVAQTPATVAFFASPNGDDSSPPSGAYYNMVNELTPIAQIINNLVNLDSSCLKLPGVATLPTALIWAANANGVIAYNSTADNNTYGDFNNSAITLEQGLLNVGVLRPVQILNIDDCASEAYQVTPVYNGSTAVTSATVVGRTGCAGVTNTGFIALQVNVDINYFSFETCGSKSCVESCC